VVEFGGAAASLARPSAASAKSAKKAREEFFAQRLAILVGRAKLLCVPFRRLANIFRRRDGFSLTFAYSRVKGPKADERNVENGRCR
jgi:hypothetical protein